MRFLVLMLTFVIYPQICFSTTSSSGISLSPPNEIDASKPALSSSQKTRWSYLIGKWFGKEATKEGGTVMWITERDDTGRYEIHFRSIDASGKVEEHIEVGEWGISGPIYFTIFKGTIENGRTLPSDSTDPYNRDAYRILRLDNNIFEYESFASGNKYKATKVPSNFIFPK